MNLLHNHNIIMQVNDNLKKGTYSYNYKQDISEDEEFLNEDVIESLFQGGKANKKRSKVSKKEKDINVFFLNYKVILEISFMESILGCDKTLDIDRNTICKLCKGMKSRIGYSTKDCSSCKGAGVRYQKLGLIMIQIECEDCDGEGSVMRNSCLYLNYNIGNVEGLDQKK